MIVQRMRLASVFLMLTVLAGCQAVGGSPVQEGAKYTPRADVSYTADTCAEFGAQFGSFLDQGLREAEASLMRIPKDAPSTDGPDPRSAVWNAQLAHVNTVSLAMARKGLRCGGDEVVAAAEPHLTPHVRQMAFGHTPALGEPRRMASYDEWRQYLVVLLTPVKPR